MVDLGFVGSLTYYMLPETLSTISLVIDSSLFMAISNWSYAVLHATSSGHTHGFKGNLAHTNLCHLMSLLTHYQQSQPFLYVYMVMCRLFEPTAIDLCARGVASSTGDLRMAFKIACCAVDLLKRRTSQQQKEQQQNEQQQQQQGALKIGPRDMAQALASLSGMSG